MTSVLVLCGCTKAAAPPVLEHSEVRLPVGEDAVSASTKEAGSRAPEPPPRLAETSPNEPAEIGAHDPHPRSEAVPEASGKTPQACIGKPRPEPKAPRAACCYPSKAPLVAAMSAVRPHLSKCVVLMTEDVETVLVRIAVGPSGSPDEVCTDALPQRGATFVQCVLHAVQSARFPATPPEQEELCGSLMLSYPLRFEKAPLAP